MRRARLSRGERTLSAALVALVAGMLAYLLLLGLAPVLPRAISNAMAAFDVAPPPPPKRTPPRLHTDPRPHAGASAPPNLTARATPLVAPPPIVVVPPPITLPAATLPGLGPDTHSGNAEQAGPGTGAGGAGNGTGSGDGGDGAGDGDDSPPVLVSGRFTGSDFRHVAAQVGTGGTVGIEYYVQPDGRVSDCQITHSSGNDALDDLTCAMVTSRYRYRPSLDANGRPVRSIVDSDEHWNVSEDRAPQ